MDWFGYSPNFHDAEVISVELRRHPEASIVCVHAWRTNSDITEEGHFRQDRHPLVTFTIKGITSLKIDGWNHQNVLSSLWAGKAEGGYILELPEIYGVDGEIAAADISVSIDRSRSDEEWQLTTPFRSFGPFRTYLESVCNIPQDPH